MAITKMETFSSDDETTIRQKKFDLFKTCPIPEGDVLNNLGLFLNSKNLSRILFFDYIYRKIVDVQGIAIEFGTRWGQNLSLLSALRGIYEPFNRHRKIVGFDTFTGLSSLSPQDTQNVRGGRDFVEGGLSVSQNYESYLERIMTVQEQDNPMSHIKKFEIIKGDASVTFSKYLEDHPETIVSFAYFDMDIYTPTKECLTLLRKKLVKGAVIGFDELNDPVTPGETVAFDEVFGLNNVKLKRYRFASRVSYFVVE
jgi:hypothetical protein